MKYLPTLLFTCLPLFLSAQTLDSAAVVRSVDSLIQANRSLIRQQKFDEALKVVETAEKMAIGAFGENHPKYAACLFDHAWTLATMERYTEAESLYLKTLVIQEETVGKENPDYAASLDDLATLYKELGQYKKAEPLHIEAKDIRERTVGKKHSSYARSLNNLAILYAGLGQYEKTEALFVEAKDIREEVSGKHLDYAQSANNLAILYSMLCQYEKAETLFIEAKDIRKQELGKDHLDYAASLDNLAVLYTKLGQYEKAEPLHIEAMRIQEKVIGKKNSQYAMSLNNLAVLYKKLGQYKKAEPLYVEAKNIQAERVGKKNPFYAQTLNNLAGLYQLLGQYERAEPLYIEAKNVWKESLGEKTPDYAEGLNNLANLYLDLKQYKKAESLYLEAKDIREITVGKGHPDYAISLNNLAVLYRELGQFEKAEPLFVEAKNIDEKTLGKDHPGYFEGLSNLATFYRESGQSEKAEPLFVEACRLQQKAIQKGMAFLSEHEMSQYNRSYLDTYQGLFSFGHKQMATSPSLVGEILDNVLFYKGMLLNNAKMLENAVAQAPDTVRDVHIRWKGLHRRLAVEYAKPIAERQNVKELEEKANTLEKELTRTVAGFDEARRQVTWQEVQEKLQPGEAAIEFIHYRYYNPDATNNVFYSALVLRPGDGAPFFVPLFEEREIVPLLKGASFGEINTRYSFQRKKGNKHKSLYDLIWKPLKPMLKDVTTVYCSPSGLLHRINLGAIPVAEGQMFTERHSLVLMGSTRQLTTNPGSEKTSGAKTAVLFGGIQYDSMAVAVVEKTDTSEVVSAGSRGAIFLPNETRDTTAWGYLQFSEQEVKNIQPYLRDAGYQSKMFSGYGATEESFKDLGQKSPSPSILHVATHGFFYPDSKDTFRQWDVGERQPVFKLSDNPMMRAGLILACANRIWQGNAPLSGCEDGILTAYEISQMNLSNTELVVLSACETGLGQIEGNEGVYGLQRAFKIAGAKYLIMSLWKVSDLTTQELMTDFYQQWLKKGLTIPDAFRAAQMNMKAQYPDAPYHWAGFILVE